ncbi:MAG TPA: hypothetical protein VHD90_12030 [Phototrophicaceae bacterium]|nr:hypothetical protein [Phototrophicaceae bacterium]
MRRLLLSLIMLLLAACNLNTADNAREIQLNATQTALPETTQQVGATTLQPTFGSVVRATPALQPLQTSACGQLRVTVGTDPAATLRLRDQPNNNATVVLLIPNNTVVTKVPGSQEISASGYTWVNIQYTDPSSHVTTGWAAKDAMKNTVTLVAQGC